MDGSAVAVEKAKQRLTEEGLLGDVKQGDAIQLAYPNEYFDGVLDIECIYANSKKDSKRIIGEIFRVLKPGGYFFSKSFMTIAQENEIGRRVDGEPHTFVNIKDSTAHSGRGIVRFTAEEEIPELYGIFPSIEYDYVIRSDNNKKHENKECLITCRQ